MLMACETAKAPLLVFSGGPGFSGGVAAGEPRAASVGRETLAGGGTAADAMVAAFFTLAVTYPAGVGLGGGGICLYYDAASNTEHELDFLPTPAAGGEVAVPAAVRGMAALHARYGKLPWAQVLSPAEQLARFGHPVSRALAARLSVNVAELRGNATLARLFLGPDGSPKREADLLLQVELAASLAQLRTRGAGDLHGGALGKLVADGAAGLGLPLTLDALRAQRIAWRKPRELKFGNTLVAVPSAELSGGVVLAALLEGLRQGEGGKPPAELAKVMGAVYRGQGPTQVGGDGAAVTADPTGSVAACTFTMGKEFGIGQQAAGTGFLLGASQPTAGQGLAPMIGYNKATKQAFYAAAVAGGGMAPAANALVGVEVLGRGTSLAEAVDRPRLWWLGEGDELWFEAGLAGADFAAFQQRRQVPFLGVVQAMWCSDGLRRSPQTCRFVSDRRGFGLALGDEF